MAILLLFKSKNDHVSLVFVVLVSLLVQGLVFNQPANPRAVPLVLGGYVRREEDMFMARIAIASSVRSSGRRSSNWLEHTE